METDIAQPLIDTIEIVTPTGVFQQPVEYKWRPKYCEHYLKFGDNSETCRAKQENEGQEEEGVSRGAKEMKKK